MAALRIAYTKGFLQKLEEMLSAGGYAVRYAKGNFRSGACLIKEQRLILVNQYLDLPGRINNLITLSAGIELEEDAMPEETLRLLQAVRKR